MILALTSRICLLYSMGKQALSGRIDVFSGKPPLISWYFHRKQDALADAQLWSSAALAQYVRALLPVGEIWTPILMNLVKGVSLIETKSLKRVSYYYQTRAFVNEVLSKGYAPSITGHSLGGGLAIITGTQTGSPVVALSGPNALISRRTFDPPLHPDDINRLTFNIIPDRDPVPRSKFTCSIILMSM
jgi:lipase ATG15